MRIWGIIITYNKFENNSSNTIRHVIVESDLYDYK
jgi:hypothetical protein